MMKKINVIYIKIFMYYLLLKGYNKDINRNQCKNNINK